MNHKVRSIMKDVVFGAFAGGIAGWAMQQVTGSFYTHEGKKVKKQEKETRRKELPSGPVVEQDALSGISGGGAVAVEKVARVTGQALSDKERQKLAYRVQYGLSISAGTAYALLRHRLPRIAGGYGLAFGVLFWLFADEVANPLLGLTPPPDDFPWQTHARGLAGHLAFGFVTETVLKIMDRA